MSKPSTTLPSIFQPILWSYDIKCLDPNAHRQTIITAAINYGDLIHWRWLVNTYGWNGVRQSLTQIPETAFRPRAARLAQRLFHLKGFHYASRSIRLRMAKQISVNNQTLSNQP